MIYVQLSQPWAKLAVLCRLVHPVVRNMIFEDRVRNSAEGISPTV